MATNEWIDSKDMQARLDKGFDFRCNECRKSIGNHVGVVSEGIFCQECKNKLVKELMGMGGSPINLDPHARG